MGSVLMLDAAKLDTGKGGGHSKLSSANLSYLNPKTPNCLGRVMTATIVPFLLVKCSLLRGCIDFEHIGVIWLLQAASR